MSYLIMYACVDVCMGVREQYCVICDCICINQPYAANYNFPIRANYGACRAKSRKRVYSTIAKR